MKFLALIIICGWMINTQALASGCSFYNFMRTTIKKEFAPSTIPNRFVLVTQSDKQVTLREEATGKIYVLPWEKTEVADAEYNSSEVNLYDILFEEGDGCGPIYRCVTGQITYQIVDKVKGLTTSFSYPQVIDTVRYNTMDYIVVKPLFPVQGSMKLDVEPLSKYNSPDPDIVEKNNPNQCGYGSW